MQTKKVRTRVESNADAELSVKRRSSRGLSHRRQALTKPSEARLPVGPRQKAGLDTEHSEAATLGARVRMLRTLKGMSQTALAKRLGLHASTVCVIEQGRRNPTGRLLCALADALGTTLDSLFARGSAPGTVCTEADDGISAMAEAEPSVSGFRLTFVPSGCEVGVSAITAECRLAAEALIRGYLSLEELAGTDSGQAWFPYPLPFTPDAGGAARLAGQVRSFCGVSQNVVIDPVALADAAGMRVIQAEWGPGPDAMVAVASALDRVVLLLRRKPSLAAATGFAELGALALGTALWDGWQAAFGRFQPVAGSMGRAEWVRAFAVGLLLPERTFTMTAVAMGIEGHRPVEMAQATLRRLAQRFGVSEALCLERARKLGIGALATEGDGRPAVRVPRCGQVAGSRNIRIHDLLWRCLTRPETAPRAREIMSELADYLPELRLRGCNLPDRCHK